MKGKLGIFVLLFIFAIVLSIYLSSYGYFSIVLEWIASLGLWGNFILIAAFIAISFPIPMGSTPLALSAGFLYGVFLGFLTTSVGAITGAALSFVLCRKWLKSCVQDKLNKQVAMTALMAAVNKHAFKICLLLRMAPIPLGLQNALLSLSKIEFKTYMISTSLGLLPELLILVYFGSTTKEFSDIINGRVNYGLLQQVILIAEVLICIFIMAFLVYSGRQAFRQVLKEGDEDRIILVESDGTPRVISERNA